MGKSIAEAMLATEVHDLPPKDFKGAGIYAIYFVGDFAPYKILKEKNRKENFSAPIYVGKAIPAGALPPTTNPETNEVQLALLSAENIRGSGYYH